MAAVRRGSADMAAMWEFRRDDGYQVDIAALAAITRTSGGPRSPAGPIARSPEVTTDGARCDAEFDRPDLPVVAA